MSATRGVFELSRAYLLQTVRSRSALIWTLAFPQVWLFLFALIYRNIPGGISDRLPGLLTITAFSGSFFGVAYTLVTEREQGILRRFWVTPATAATVVAANAVGIGRAALDEALAFAREHDRLGDPRVRDRLERAARKLKKARLLCLRAGWLADYERPNIVEASMSKAVAAEVGQEVTSLGMELIGAVGARGDHLIEKLYRDVKAMDIVEGTGQIQRVIMGRQLVGLPR